MKLNNKIWDENQKIYPKIRGHLLTIAKNFVKWVKVENIKIKDIIFTGSLANFNFHPGSDLDLHIYFDLSKYNEKQKTIILNYLMAKKTIWNDSHDVEIKEFEVELYPEDNKTHQISTGMYSLIKNKWLVKPHEQHIKIDKQKIQFFYQPIKKKIDEFEKEIDDKIKLYNDIKATMEKIKAMRKHGLSTKERDFSPENLAFKLLRNNGDIKRLLDLKFKTYDDVLTIKEDVGLKKGEWKLENIQAMSKEELDKIFELFRETYKQHRNILRTISSPEALKKNAKALVLDYDNDNDLDAFMLLRDTPYGNKISYLGSENNLVAKSELMKKLFELLKRTGWFIEGGQKIDAACKKYNIPSVNDMDIIKKIIKHPVLKVYEDGYYERKAAMGVPVKKKLYGQIN